MASIAAGRTVFITAQRLADGAPLYRTEDGAWTDDLSEAALYAGQAAEEALARALTEETTVVGVYLIDAENGTPVARHRLREEIRMRGPTVRLDLGRQAGDA